MMQKFSDHFESVKIFSRAGFLKTAPKSLQNKTQYFSKMTPIVKKNRKKTLNKKETSKNKSKFFSQVLINRRKKKKRPKTKGIVFIKNLPHGFYEEQLRAYFSQFGAVTRIRLGRSPTTLKSRGYAFIEFRYPEVAEIAADAMNNYIMFHRIVKTKYIPPSEIYHDYFRSNIFSIKENGIKVLTSKKLLARKAIVEQTNRLMTDNDQKNRIKIVAAKHKQRKRILEELDIDYDIDSIAKNLSNEVIKEPVKTVFTINDLKDEDLDDDADETFDPTKFDIESGDEFEDYEYDLNESTSDEEKAKENAIQTAKKIKSKANKNDGNVQKEMKEKVAAKKVKNQLSGNLKLKRGMNELTSKSSKEPVKANNKQQKFNKKKKAKKIAMKDSSIELKNEKFDLKKSSLKKRELKIVMKTPEKTV